MLIDVLLPLAIADVYTYNVPDTIACPAVGMRVIVPLGKKEVVGIVYCMRTQPVDEQINVRDILQVIDSQAIVNATQLQLWQWMADYYMCTKGEVMAAALPAKALDRQYTLGTPKRKVRLPQYGPSEPLHALSQAQQTAYDSILSQAADKEVILLQGVTGSGKTEVYMHLIQQVLQRGQDVLYLVPEIALTTQLTDRLSRCFGEQLYVYHSRVTDVQRMEIYRRCLCPDTEPQSGGKLFVGARSAIFLPVHKPGLIIVDEEHEHSYKQQDPAPRYHARSAAIMLGHFTGANVLLGTATPSIESYHHALSGKYGFVPLKERYAGLELPTVTLIDLKRQYHRKEMYGHFSDPLVGRIREELAKKKQVILFQNRRGYAPYIQCTNCGAVPKCTDCDVSLTLHLNNHLMVCHHCGQSISQPARCPICGGELKIHGFGTERLEEEVAQYFPEARVLRMDQDTTQKKAAYEDIIRQFSQHECDILIGTQMVSKGLDFDDVSLVAVLNADTLLHQPDFRSYERGFQMLCQVAGRAGRKGSQGEVIIQTMDPTHPIYSYVTEHNYEGLAHAQIQERKLFHFPPFFRQINITLRHKEIAKVDQAAAMLQANLKQVFNDRCSGIITPSVARAQNYYIRMIRVRIETTANFNLARQLIREQIHRIASLPQTRSVNIMPDVDPL